MILVVVDMQEGFEATKHGGVLDAVVALVTEAVRANTPIILLRYAGHGPIYARIRQEVEGYALVAEAVKRRMNGADLVAAICRQEGWDGSVIKLCGVNTFECVASTAENLVIELPDSIVEVQPKACNDKVIGWLAFPQHPNIRGVPGR